MPTYVRLDLACGATTGRAADVKLDIECGSVCEISSMTRLQCFSFPEQCPYFEDLGRIES
jgi:hypothetical protein